MSLVERTSPHLLPQIILVGRTSKLLSVVDLDWQMMPRVQFLLQPLPHLVLFWETTSTGDLVSTLLKKISSSQPVQ